MELVSIVICTNRFSIKQIINNYERQSYNNKELIIIINTKFIDINIFKNECKDMDDVKIFQIDDKKTLGECYNFAIKNMNGDYFCKMDDDDFYDVNYITRQMFFLKKYNCDIIGKSHFYLYDSHNHILYSKSIPHIILGGTMIIKKQIFDTIQFQKLNRGEDSAFLQQAKQYFKIISSDIEDFVYIRYQNNYHNHTYNVDIQTILGKDYKIIYYKDLLDKLKIFTSINNTISTKI